MSVFKGLGLFISKRVGRAIMDYKMLSGNDKIAVAVSGGKDSLTLLHILLDRKRFAPIKYDILAIHIDLGYPRSLSKELRGYFKKLGVKYHIERTSALKKERRKEINCFQCSWNRRKALFQAADRLGYNKVALGHHYDDIIQTTLLNLFFNGEISTMVPRQELFGGKITLIRPLAYVEEDMIKRFAKAMDFPSYDCVCPNSVVSNRAKMSRIIRDIKKICPDVKKNIFRSVRRVKEEYLL